MSNQPAARVVVDVQVRSVDRTFDYAVPEELREALHPGHRVLVPFGQRLVEGYVVDYPIESSLAELKPINRLLDQDPLLPKTGLMLADWLRERYLCLYAQGLQCWLPVGSKLRSNTRVNRRYKDVYQLVDSPDSKSVQEALARAPRQRDALEYLAKQGNRLSAAEFREAGFAPSLLHALVERGMVERQQVLVRRDPLQGRTWKQEKHQLTPKQAEALKRITRALDEEAGRFLLHGVTGSGKTLVYLESIKAALERGKTAIVLVPEISLTPQAVAAFKGWFGDQVAVLHSRLSLGERADQWQAAAEGSVSVVLGARSAVFAPLHRVGLIIIDEEHEYAYKQEETPRYHAREVARARMEAEGGVLLLGTATPSLESYQAALDGDLEILSLPERVDGKPLPKVDVVDMREELLVGNRTMFSRLLQTELHSCLARHEQAILFLNRRGFASFVLCRECGATIGCDHCKVTLTFHEPDDLFCHYCGMHQKMPARCPKCGSKYLRPFGAGTQRVEVEVKRMFPTTRVLRMDVDTTGRKGAHERLWRAFVDRKADVLVGTQMVAKGLHFPGVTLVGVMAADTSLHFPDFRAAERTFHLLTQVAGRAGRGDEPGRVVVQTYAPEHYSIENAKTHDFTGFAQKELFFRRQAGYPPFSSLVRFLITGDSDEGVAATAHKLARACTHPDVNVVGPAPAPLSRLKDRFRWHILLKGDSSKVRQAAQEALQAMPNDPNMITVDVDPVSLL